MKCIGRLSLPKGLYCLKVGPWKRACFDWPRFQFSTTNPSFTTPSSSHSHQTLINIPISISAWHTDLSQNCTWTNPKAVTVLRNFSSGIPRKASQSASCSTGLLPLSALRPLGEKNETQYPPRFIIFHSTSSRINTSLASPIFAIETAATDGVYQTIKLWELRNRFGPTV